MGKFKLKIDLGRLPAADAEHLRGLLGSAAPDGAKRFAVSSLYRTEPQLLLLHRDIHDVAILQRFIERLCVQVVRDVSIAEAVEQKRLSAAAFHFWFLALVRNNFDLLPEELHYAVVRVLERMAQQANAQELPDAPTAPVVWN